ncbi:hypothetical protein C9I57_20220 [Trinickia symbiotica]|uniref:Uncharacterized protein n=1 Tax=Trinickia symbiotica TaxID=863227 RepID=A0A2T3XQM2_9BURK|nr:hypothetical protein [Trinickia symbiotica]PTB18826.1 hypothetical protein C9I57_20220 [Trinickia symbiotica]
MFFLDSDLRGPLADYTFHYGRQPVDKGPPSTGRPARVKRSKWVARVLGAMALNIFELTQHEGEPR